MSKRVALVLNDSALKIIDEHASERTRGDWVSAVILGWDDARMIEGVGALERVEARLIRLEDLIRETTAQWAK